MIKRGIALRKTSNSHLLIMVVAFLMLGTLAYAQSPGRGMYELSERSSMRVELTFGTGGKADNLILDSFFPPQPVTYRTMILPVATLDLVLPGLWQLDWDKGIGLRFGFGYQGYEETPSMTPTPFFDIHAGAQFELEFARQFIAEAGVGLSIVVSPQFRYGLGMHAGLNYLVSKALSIVAQGEARLLFSGALSPYELTGVMRLGAGYSF